MKMSTLRYIPLFLLFGCGDRSMETPSLFEIETTAVPERTTDAAVSTEKDAASTRDVNDTDDLHDEGSARPRGILTKEAVLEKPDFPKPAPDQMVQIPSGTLLVGSPPQDRLRVDFAESDMVPTKITSFEMDAMPFPNDPDRPFLTGVTRPEAEHTCASVGKRLCTELEWEWACKSADGRRYPSGNAYQADNYPKSERYLPASPFGIFAMGRLLEWTVTPWGKESDQVERGTVRGYADGFETTAVSGRRCAHRWRMMPSATNPSLGFRCCRGDENNAQVVMEPPRPPFSLYKTMKPDKFASIIRSIPELEAVHDNPHMYSDADIRTVLARRGSDRETLADQGFHFRWKPMRWIPRQGMELWVAVGRSNQHGFIVALHEVVDNEKYVHASSLVLWNQPAPLALVYREGHRDELYWAPCWHCRDGGAVAFDDEKNEIIITHRW
jgi:formylglycine-generating enzyme required for sulfatase activity